MKPIPSLAVLTFLTTCTVSALAAPPIPRSDNCSNSALTHHTLVYFGSTSVLPIIRTVATILYGPPTWTCPLVGPPTSQTLWTFNADVDFDNSGTYDACVTLYVGSHL